MTTDTDLKGIKAALRYLIEKEMNNVITEEINMAFRHIYPNNAAREQNLKDTRKRIEKRYKPILDGLK
jgi:hypothetical protein